MPEPRTLLLTRPEAQSADFAAAVERTLPGRFRTIVAPLIEIAPVPGAIDLDGIQALLFTSANGVAQFAARCPERGLPALCVGDLTAAAAVEAGFSARSATGDVRALARLAAAVYVPGSGAMLHLRGRHAAGDLVALLAAEGVHARAVEIYEQRARPMPPEAAASLAAGTVYAVALFSPRTARIFAQQAADGAWALERTAAVSLSAAADAELGTAGFGARRIAASPDRDGMLQVLSSL